MSQNDADLQRWLTTIKEIEHRLTSSDRYLHSLSNDNAALKTENARRKCDLDRIRAQRDRQQLELEPFKRKQSALLQETSMLQSKLETQDKKLQHIQAETSEHLQQNVILRNAQEVSKAAVELKDVSA